MSYPFSTKVHAFNLYVESGLTFEAVAARTGVSLSQLKDWAAKDAWATKKDETQRNRYDAIVGFWDLTADLVRTARETKSWKDVSAALGAMKSAPKIDAEQTDVAALFLVYLNQQVAYLRAKDPEALRYLEPHIRGFADSLKQAEAA